MQPAPTERRPPGEPGDYRFSYYGTLVHERRGGGLAGEPSTGFVKVSLKLTCTPSAAPRTERVYQPPPPPPPPPPPEPPPPPLPLLEPGATDEEEMALDSEEPSIELRRAAPT